MKILQKPLKKSNAYHHYCYKVAKVNMPWRIKIKEECPR